MLVCQMVLAQVYQPFPKDSANWTYIKWSKGYGTPYGTEEGMFFTNGTDTLINGKTYTKVMARYRIINSPTNFPPANNGIGTSDRYRYAIREDSQKLYIVDKDTTEQLLWNFNLAIGDSIKQWYEIPTIITGQGGFINVKMTVTSIDSVWVDNCYRKRFTLSGDKSNNIKLIEGLGINGYFLSFPYSLYPTLYKYSPACFTHKGISYSPYSEACYYLFSSSTPSSIENIYNNTPSAYPNPFNDVLNINTAGKIYIYNTTGICVLQKETASQSIINTAQLMPGTYLIVITDNKGTRVSQQKAVKQ